MTFLLGGWFLSAVGIERHDRRVAASIQFQRGDAVIFNIGGKEMEGEIAGLNVSQGCHLVRTSTSVLVYIMSVSCLL